MPCSRVSDFPATADENDTILVRHLPGTQATQYEAKIVCWIWDLQVGLHSDRAVSNLLLQRQRTDSQDVGEYSLAHERPSTHRTALCNRGI